MVDNVIIVQGSEDKLKAKLEEARNSENSGDFFLASFHYKNATELARSLGNSTILTFCKNKVVEMNRKSDSEYKEISFEQQVPTKEINKVVNSILDGDIETVLKRIGLHPALIPKIQHIETSAKKTMPISYQIASLSTISTGGHLLKGGADGNITWTMKMYSIHQGLITDLYLSRVFSGLTKKGLNKENLIDYFEKTRIFPNNNLEIISVGIERYFENDYVSALHILIPQFENIFLYISEKAGIDIVSLNRTKEISTQLKTLSSDHLSSDAFQKIWGKDFCEQLKFVLFEQLGYTLRHKIAHGQIGKDECTITNADLILYLFLVLSARTGVEC